MPHFKLEQFMFGKKRRGGGPEHGWTKARRAFRPLHLTFCKTLVSWKAIFFFLVTASEQVI